MSGTPDPTGPDRLTVAAIGPVGSRLFLLQCQLGGRRQLTLKIEKQQVGVLASHLLRLVQELGNFPERDQEVPFDEDAEPDWTVRNIGISYDESDQHVTLVLEELVAEDETAETARISISLDEAAAFAVRATQLVEAGRPPCPLCGLPLDPSGHACPRTNGHRPPAP